MQKVTEAIKYVLESLRRFPLCESTVNRYEMHYRYCLLPYCKNNGIELFSDDDLQKYVEWLMLRHKRAEISWGYLQVLRKAAAILADCMQNREITWKFNNYQQSLCKHYEKILIDYRIYLSQSLSPNTIRNHLCVARQFLDFLGHCGIQDINKLTPEFVKGFISDKARNYKASMPFLTIKMRKLLLFLKDTGLADVNAERHLVNPAPSHKKLLPCFTDDEADAILNVVDRNTPLGKRDYAIMNIALWTGLRGADITELKRSDIDWRRNMINLVQDKTNVSIQTELTPRVGNAIMDYILNGRPETNCPYIFVNHISPTKQLGRSIGSNLMWRYREKAGISHEAGDGKSFHAFRRTLGTRLVRAGIPINSVADMLGQLKVDSAKAYIALDNEGLRVCCMDISLLTSRKDGLNEV